MAKKKEVKKQEAEEVVMKITYKDGAYDTFIHTPRKGQMDELFRIIDTVRISLIKNNLDGDGVIELVDEYKNRKEA